jgi:AcrR family transcriptional regulator
MLKQRKKADSREKDLRMAILRIKHGRAHTGGKSVTIAAVAREAGVSAALIHNYYPTIADAIRVEQGRDGRSARDAKQLQLREERAKARDLRQQVDDLRNQVARLSSINETLLADNEALRTRLGDGKVVRLRAKTATPR